MNENRQYRLGFGLMLIVALSACAASGPIYSPAPAPKASDALVYIYRPNGFVLGGRDAYFQLDGKNVVHLSAAGYTRIYLQPGAYEMVQSWPIDLIGFKSLHVPLTVSAGKTYYYRFTTGTGSSRTASCGGVGDCLTYGWELTRVTDADAAGDIARCHYQAPQSVDGDGRWAVQPAG